jgi:hypothetical protein
MLQEGLTNIYAGVVQEGELRHRRLGKGVKKRIYNEFRQPSGTSTA